MADNEQEEQMKWEAGDVYKSENGWLEARVGTMPLVIGVPHGGRLQPDSIPDRTCEGISTVSDLHVIELAKLMEQDLRGSYDKQPYIVMAHLNRDKIDLNRGIEEATCGNAAMKQVWHQYNQYINRALSEAVAEFGFALFIDLHGHSHKNQRLELGYNLDKSEITAIYVNESAADKPGQKSTLRNLLKMTDLNLKELLTGEHAFGTLIAKEDIAAVPSMQDPYPAEEEPYLYTGYNQRHYYTDDYPHVFGWMIETHRYARWEVEGRKKFAKAFAKVIPVYLDFVKSHLND